MDNFWIIIIIIGAVISLSQKNQKKAPAESDDYPQPNPQQEWERRLREIMEEHKTSTPSSPAQPRPVGGNTRTLEQTVTPIPNAKPQMKMRPKHSPTEASRRVADNTSHPARPSTIMQANRGEVTSAVSNKDNTANSKIKATSTKHESDFSIDRILDDFSMEKAVIYAEILKPKHEEY